MRPIGSPSSLEKRRRRAVELSKEGKGIREVARQVRASPGAVHRWIEDWKKNGDAALSAKPTPGRPGKLTAKQREKLPKLLLAGAMSWGFPNELWTLKRIATLIRMEFGVRYHPSHLWRVLQACGWSCQVPERRAIQRDEDAIAHWMRHKRPAIKKARRLGARIAFLDESGFMLIPTRRRTWNPRGQTPIVRYNYKHDRISAIAALTAASRRARMGLHVQFRQDNFKAVHAAKFLRMLLGHLRGHVILLWDSGRIHKGPAINAVRDAFPRLHLERFPGYAPELNPVEQLWNDFKRHTGNSIFRGKQDIRLSLHGSTRRVRRSKNKLRSFVLSSGLPSAPWI